ncbi:MULTISPECIES: glutamate--cysteine ligase [unclassified Halorhabdus]|uniref:glutamate--cysteine ligase n=1 Tax=unclassified Halorhabdus TaxID=2621901 RepID=UPI0023DAD225|nr:MULTISPECIES: glutamate--cysteine ligase [unclassified Halorhabdus]WEL17344.1 Glutamate-cysteine ligase family 2(GCS2) [Halorhabdus sp. SVX81]WEL21226.1 Glutamate-cysteine ligase family 2(GCS2) [Halorhabdus sp. BNX81]
METASESPFTELGTLGIEEEFFVVDESGRPVSGTDTLVYDTEPPAILEDRLDHELFKFVIESQTPIIEEPGDAAAMLAAVRGALVEHAREHGFGIAAAGLHPGARWRELEHAEKPRYQSQLDRIQYPQHRNTTAGLHVHVGVDDAEKAVWIANQLRWHLPIILALSANSPYWNGFDTGLASARAKLFEGLPNTGMPTAFDSFAAFQRFERRMIETNSISDRGELWFDVRPHTEYGTVEVRTADAQADIDRVLALVEYVHELVLDFAARYEDGERGQPIRRELLDENKWRAIRHGRDASFITRDGADTIDLTTAIERDVSRLTLDRVAPFLAGESGATRQRRRHEEGVDALYSSLLVEDPR